MAYLDELGSGRNGVRASGHRFQDVRLSDHAKAHLGDMYVGHDDPLGRLPRAEDAPFNSLAKQHEPTCLADTRADLLHEIHCWAEEQDERCIFWLSGLAGTGKSTIARTVAGSYKEKQRLAASFFFSRGGGDVSHAGRFVTSIAFQLAHNVSKSRQHVCDAVTERSDIISQSLRDQWHHFVLSPLSKLHEPSSYLLVIDALDECDNEDDIRIIVQLLAEARSGARARLRVLLTSRPEVPIRYGFRQIADMEYQDFVLHNISPSVIDYDISVFLEYNFRLIAQECCQAADWPGNEAIRRLCQSASGLFIWAATACRFIQQGGGHFANDRLQTILGNGDSTEDLPTDGWSTEDYCAGDPHAVLPEKRLNNMYLKVLRNHVPKYEWEKKIWYDRIRKTLGVIITLLSPLSASSLAKLLYVPEQSVHQTLHELHSIFNIPQDYSGPLRLHHPSFRDFLLNKDRCGDAFWVDEKQAHAVLTNHCIKLMSSSLKQDICGVDAPGMFVADMERGRVEQSLPPELQYACLYWIQHLEKSSIQSRDNDEVHQFLQKHLLHWLEALGWMKKVPEGVHAIIYLESFASLSESPSLSALIYDAKRFMLYNRAVIEQAPLQTYSMLVFAPTASVVRDIFKDSIPKWIIGLPRVEENWNAMLQTLEGHKDWVNTVAFSLDYKTLASASNDKTIKLWDTRSGALLQTLKDHKNWVTIVAFSPDNKTLASASDDWTVKIWDAKSGALLQTLEGHRARVTTVAFSPDSKTLASASNDKTVKLWDTRSGALLQTLQGHEDWVITVVFSPNSKTLASVSDDRTVKLWDTRSGALLQTLEGHEDRLTTVAFSPDSKTLASASNDKMIKLSDTRSGALLQTLQGHESWVTTVAFSPDGKTLASASSDKTVKLWGTRSGALLQMLEGHEDRVNRVTFSPDSKTLASASNDKTVKLWDTRSGALLQTLKGHESWVNTMAFSPDGKTLASASWDMTVKLWDTRLSAMLQTIECHEKGVTTMAFSPDSKTLASASSDKTVKLWDTRSGAMLQTLEGHEDRLTTVAFSPDSKMLASASNDKTVKLWDTRSGALLQTLEGHESWVTTVAFSPDSKTLASASNDRTIKLWDTRSGAVLQMFRTDTVFHDLFFSQDGTLLCTSLVSFPTLQEPFTDNISIKSPRFLPFVSVRDQWVYRSTERMLWLPSEHRPDCVASHGGIVGFGYRSGRVVMMELVS